MALVQVRSFSIRSVRRSAQGLVPSLLFRTVISIVPWGLVFIGHSPPELYFLAGYFVSINLFGLLWVVRMKHRRKGMSWRREF
jgi:hypothetical protein